MEKVKTKKSKAPELVEGRTKEWNDIPERQYRSNQGRSPQKTEANYKVMFLTLAGRTHFINRKNLYSPPQPLETLH